MPILRPLSRTSSSVPLAPPRAASAYKRTADTSVRFPCGGSSSFSDCTTATGRITGGMDARLATRGAVGAAGTGAIAGAVLYAFAAPCSSMARSAGPTYMPAAGVSRGTEADDGRVCDGLAVSRERSSGKSRPGRNSCPSSDACARSVSCPRSRSRASIWYGPQTRPCSVLIQYCLPPEDMARMYRTAFGGGHLAACYDEGRSGGNGGGGGHRPGARPPRGAAQRHPPLPPRGRGHGADASGALAHPRFAHPLRGGRGAAWLARHHPAARGKGPRARVPQGPPRALLHHVAAEVLPRLDSGAARVDAPARAAPHQPPVRRHARSRPAPLAPRRRAVRRALAPAAPPLHGGQRRVAPGRAGAPRRGGGAAMARAADRAQQRPADLQRKA